MNIIVLTRQVKAADEVKCDFTGIEAAVRFKEQVKAKMPAAECQISVLVLGYKESAVKQVKDAVAMGCDCGWAVEDENLFQLDAWSCAMAFAEALKDWSESPQNKDSSSSGFDLIISGGFPLDADTVPIGLLTASLLKIPFVSNVENIVLDTEDSFQVVRKGDGILQKLRVKKPCLMSVLPHPEAPIYKTIAGINKAYSQEVEKTAVNITKDNNKIEILSGIGTNPRKRGTVLTAVSTDEVVNAMISKMAESHLL